MKKAIGSCLAAFLLLGAAAPLGALADTPYKTYTYDYSWEPVETPHAYTVGRVLTGAGLGVEDFLNPSDVFVDGNQNVYVADTGNNRICVFDAAFGQSRILAGFTREDGTEDAFKAPSGVYVNEAGEIYVADTDNARIVRLRADGSLVRVYDAPEISLLAEDYVYMPTTLVVDKAERMYVVARNVNMGVIQLSREGLFDGFVGAAKVSYNPLDYLWRTFMTEEQVSRTAAFVPTEYNNIAIDASDFLYVTSSAIEYADLYGYITNPVAAPRIAPVKRLNPSGNDVLKRTTNLPVAGDVLFDPGNQQDTSVFSSIIDVAIGQEGTYTILDASHNRYFTYYRTGELLYAFGVRGNQDGTTTRPVSIAYKGSDFLALDGATGKLTLYSRTAYGDQLMEALHLYNDFRYDDAVAVWEQVLQKNANFDIAYINIGKALLRQERYKEAMTYFKLAEDADNYSKAFREYRNSILTDYVLVVIAAALVLLVLLVKGLGYVSRQNRKEKYKDRRGRLSHQLMYALYVMVHPFDGFWDLKHEKRGSLKAANILMVLAVLALLIQNIFRAFILYPHTYDSSFSYATQVAQVVLPVLLWVTANWCLTTLMDGKAAFRDIYIATAYSLGPVILLLPPLTLLSHFVVTEEAAYITMLTTLAYGWMFLLIFFGNMVTQEYTLGKAVGTTAMTVVGIGVILFLVLVIATTLNSIAGFIASLTREILFRL